MNEWNECQATLHKRKAPYWRPGDSGDGSDDIHKPIIGLIGLMIANQSSFQQKVTMQERHLCWPLTFSLTPQWPPRLFSL